MPPGIAELGANVWQHSGLRVLGAPIVTREYAAAFCEARHVAEGREGTRTGRFRKNDPQPV